MKEKSSSLLKLWRTCSVETPPYLLPDDREFLGNKINTQCCTFPTADSYMRSASFDDPSDSKFHIGLLPQPFVGDLSSARIFLLMLNPGMDAAGYVAQANMPGFRQSLIANLFQSRQNHKYPFFYLNPLFYNHPGSIYWRDKLRKLLFRISEQRGMSYLKVMKWAARKFACLQLVPYHSAHFSMSGRLLRKLPSAQAVIAHVHETLLPKAKQGEILLIVLRNNRFWNLSGGRNVVVYSGSQCRGASLTPTSPGGKTMLHFLRNRPSILDE